MKKLISLGCVMIVSLLLFRNDSVNAGNQIQASIYPVTISIDHNQVNMPNDLYILNESGNAYVPLRYFASLMGYETQYDPTASSISLYDMKNVRVGPLVDIKTAKLVAFEIYQAKKIKEFDSVFLTKEEMKTYLPAEAQNLTPIYYKITVLDQQDQSEVVYVSSNNENHHFVMKE